ncbi:MAG: hypothetical protein AUJ92_09370 [Armatimonadetes bacterium CG2_30_59_28]|nr:MAG: hypothetical protein AUJ92_09370 [Armatimonadetes bacterium CG2_30_59_28]
MNTFCVRPSLALILLSALLSGHGHAQQGLVRTGAAFVVDPRGFLLTCAHLIDQATKLEVVLGEKTYEPKVVAVDSQTDVAILGMGVATSSSLPLAYDDAVKREQVLYLIGFPPISSRKEITKTAVAAAIGVTVRNQVPGVQFQTESNIGDGGPLLNSLGEVVGIVNSHLQAGSQTQKVDFAVAIGAAKRLLRAKDAEWPAVGAKEPLDEAGVTSRAVSSVALLIATLPEPKVEEVEGEGEKEGGEEPEDEARPDCMWASPEEMIDVTNSISISPESLQSLDVESLQDASSQMLGAVYFLQGLDLEDSKLTEEALVYLKKAEKLRPNSPLTGAALARVAQAMGETGLAAEALGRAQELDTTVNLQRRKKGSNMWIPRKELESVRQKLSSISAKGTAENVEILRAATARSAAMFAVWKGDYRWQRGVAALAETEYSRGLALDPECPEAIVANAYVADRKGDLEQAQELLRKAYELDPRSPRVRAAAADFANVYRKDFLPPKVEILSPREGEEIKPAKASVLEFTVKDDLGKVQGVEVFIDTTSIAKVFGPGKHKIEWNSRGLQYTEPTIRVVAEDAGGNRTEAKVKVKVTR